MRAKLLILTFLTFVLITFAIPTMPGIWRTAKLADGTEIRLEQVGDENLHYWRDVRGVCYNVDDEGVATPIANIGAVRAKSTKQRPPRCCRHSHGGHFAPTCGQTQGAYRAG